MKKHYLLPPLISLLLAAGAFIPSRIVRTALLCAGVAASVVMFLLPGTLMPMCMMQTMRCYTIFQPFVRIMSALEAAVCAVGTAREFLKKSAK